MAIVKYDVCSFCVCYVMFYTRCFMLKLLVVFIKLQKLRNISPLKLAHYGICIPYNGGCKIIARLVFLMCGLNII